MKICLEENLQTQPSRHTFVAWLAASPQFLRFSSTAAQLLAQAFLTSLACASSAAGLGPAEHVCSDGANNASLSKQKPMQPSLRASVALETPTIQLR